MTRRLTEKKGPRKRRKKLKRRGPSQRQLSKIERLVTRDGPKCWLCGKPVDPKLRTGPMCASVDHATPKKYGGTNDVVNFRLAHKLCNNKRGHMRASLAKKLIKRGFL